MEVLISAEKTLQIEAEAILAVKNQLDDAFVQVVNTIQLTTGRLIITGMGKSGVIGMKLAATFSSTGTPSFFLHPAEAMHGDLGMITADDLVLALSYSGETEELLRIIPYIQSYASSLIAMTGNSQSTIARAANMHISVRVDREACPNGLAPTASTTATLAMGDALAVAVMEQRNFKPENFARFHPGGSLGRKLLYKVKDVMHTDNLPVVAPDAAIIDVIHAISSGRLGLSIVEDTPNQSIGIITDGDMRRAMESNQENFFSLIAKEVMTPNARIISPKASLSQAEEIMQHYKISALIVMHDSHIEGVVQIYDL